MDPFKPQGCCGHQHPRALLAGRGRGLAEEGTLVVWGSLRLSPTPANLEAVTPRQGHHLVVMSAAPQGLAEGGIALAQGDKGIELADFVEKAL
jgi:hypothetical protein